MGCGKSKHDVVASANTVLKRKKSSVERNKDQENGAQTKDDNNNSNVNNGNVKNSGVEVQKDGNNNVVREVVGGKVDDVDSNGVKSKTENASFPEETLLQKKDDIVVAGENNANEGEEKMVEKIREEVGVVVADEVENKTEKPDVEEEVKEEEKKDNQVDDGEEGLVLKEVSEKSQGSEEDDTSKLNEDDQKVNDDAPLEEENENGDGKGSTDDMIVKE